MKSIKYYLVIFLLVGLLALNFSYLGKRWKSGNITNNGLILDCNDYNVINKTKNALLKKRVKFIYNITACPPCIETMYNIIASLSGKSDISIDVILAHDNYKEIKAFCDLNYLDLYENVSFYQVNLSYLKKRKITTTPFVQGENGDKVFFNFTISTDEGYFWKVLKKYL